MTPRDFTYMGDREPDSRPLPHQEPAQRGKYSLARAIRKMAMEGKASMDGLEAETSAAIADRTGRKPHGLFVPLDIDVRALSTTTGAGGIPTILSGTMIDVLRAKMICTGLGATVLPDLVGGKFAFPEKTATSSLGWIGEGNPVQEGGLSVLHQVPFEPRTTGAYIDLTRKAVVSIGNIEEFVIDDLLSAIAVEVDRVALDGRGINNEPLGLAQNPSVQTIPIDTNGGAPTHAVLVAMEQAVGNANADVGRLAFATTPDGRAKLRLTEKVATSGRFLWDDDNRILGYPAVATNQLPNTISKGSGTDLSPILFGNWSDLVIGMWGAVDILIDPYRFSTEGFVRIRGLQDVDVNVRHGESFCLVADMVTS